MTCLLCHWWRIRSDTPTDDNDIPKFGRCIALPPSPSMFAVDDIKKWNESELVVVWPQTHPSDHCSGFLPRAMIDQETGQLLKEIVPPDDDTPPTPMH